jgi:hypothetical protein
MSISSLLSLLLFPSFRLLSFPPVFFPSVYPIVVFSDRCARRETERERVRGERGGGVQNRRSSNSSILDICHARAPPPPLPQRARVLSIVRYSSDLDSDANSRIIFPTPRSIFRESRSRRNHKEQRRLGQRLAGATGFPFSLLRCARVTFLADAKSELS